MLIFPNTNHDPALNLAMEEYILSGMELDKPVLFFYINAPSIIIGRHQNTADEIALDFVRENAIQIVRRCSGGGAVYHDLGNLNYSLIRPGDTKASSDFSVLLTPILNALHSLGLAAEKSGRNDLTVNGAKFSGNAYYHNKYGSVLHGTLLYDSDLSVLSRALRPDAEKLLSKGVRSVRSRVTCIKPYLTGVHSTEELRSAITDYFGKTNSLTTRNFSDIDLYKIEELAEKRYRSNSWTYGESPAFDHRCRIRHAGGSVDFRAEVRETIINKASFFGDFFCTGDINDLENAVTGIHWLPDELTARLAGSNWQQYFPTLPLRDFISAVFSQET